MDLGADREDPLAIGLVDRAPELTGEHERYLFGAANADVVGDEGLEETPRSTRVVEHEGAGDFDLAHRELVVIASCQILVGEWHRDHGRPAPEEPLDVTGR